MSIIGSNILAGASGQAGYNINNSLRFRSSASASLSRTPASSGNRKTWTWSAWVKRGTLSVQLNTLLVTKPSSGANDNNTLQFSFNSDNALTIGLETAYYLTTTQVFRDPSAWYHIVLAVDTTQATASNRVKIYINGTQVTAFAVDLRSSITQNQDLGINLGSQLHQIGALAANSWYFDGYMTEVNLIDGQALTPSSFGETSLTTGSWIPKKYTSTYGTNGFYLKFSDIATTSGSNAGLGKDFSGNGNYYNTNNISVTAGVTYDAMLDVPTNTSATVANYCVLNPLDKNATGVTISSANLKNTTSSLNVGVRGTMAVSSGKWYWETTITTATNTPQVGIATRSWALDYVGSSNGVSYLSNATKYVNSIGTNYGATFTTGDIIGVALDLDGGSITFYKNNVSQGSAATGLSGEYFPAVGGQVSDVTDTNFGQRPFTYTAPSGFVALNTYNLPTPTILQGNKYMDATLYTGTGASLAITNAGAFKPDLVWVKGRSGATDHALYDSVRGTTNDLVSNSTAAATTQATGLTAFGTNGFTVGALAKMNTSAATYVGWQWQAGQGTTTAGTGTGGITSVTQSVSTTAGFSIVQFTASGSNGTVTHGLGVAPSVVIVKDAASTGNWAMYHKSLPSAAYYLYMNTTAAQGNTALTWNSTAPTSSVFSIGTWHTADRQIAYCWAEIAGFSAFGSYTGNGSADGPFIFTGFRPKYVLVKCSSSSLSSGAHWVTQDTSRSTYNAADSTLYPNLSNAEGTSGEPTDFLSNGFKIRNTLGRWNSSGETFIYMAFAENPFKNSNSR